MSATYPDALANACVLRESPIVLWPLGPTAQVLARRLAQDARLGQRESGVVQLFDGEENFQPALKELVSGIAQKGRFRGAGAEAEVRLLVGTWEVTQPVGKLLRKVSEVLGAAMPGNQVLTVALLIPPSVARPEDVRKARDTLQAVSQAMGEVPFFSSAFVFPVLADLFRHPDDAADSLIDLSDFLFRSAIDADTIALVHRMGDPLIRNRRHSDGEPAGLASLTARRVRYDPAELLRYLHARFQHELFTFGLFNREGVSKEQREVLRAQGASLIDEVFQALLKQVASLGQWEGPNVAGEEDTLDADTLRATLAQAIATGEIRAQSSLTGLFQWIEGRLRGELDGLLDRSPGFLAGAAVFLDALRGEPPQGEPGAEAGGITGLDQVFRRQPMGRLAASLFKPWFSAALLRYGLSPPDGTADEDDLLESSAKLIEIAAEAQGAGLGSPGRFLVRAWRRIRAALATPAVTPADGRALFLDVAGFLLTEAEAVAGCLNAFDQTRDDLREQMQDLRHAYPPYKFWRLGPYLEGKRQLQEQVDELAQQREEVLVAYALTCTMFQSLANEFLWPHLGRVLMIDGVRQRYEEVRGEFDRYVDNLGTTWAAEWAEAGNIKVTDRWSDSTVNSTERCDLLYRQILGRPDDWARLVSTALAFVPAALGWAGQRPPDYAPYKSLREHVHTDPGLLIRRVADFAEDLFKAAGRLDVLDIIELQGKDSARRLLVQTLSAMDAQPEFASGKIPRLLQQGLFQRQRMIRCTPGIGDRLRSGYGGLFTENDEFKDIDSPDLLDLTTFTFGFPASLLHVLSNGAPPAGADVTTVFG